MSRLHVDACRCLWIAPQKSSCDVLSIIIVLTSAYASVSAPLCVGLWVCVFVCSQVRRIQLCECSGGWVCMFLNHLLYALLGESLDDGRYNASQTFPSNQKFMAVDRALCGITMLHVIGTYWNQLNNAKHLLNKAGALFLLSWRLSASLAIKSQDVASLLQVW